jgi:hypothetical protein
MTFGRGHCTGYCWISSNDKICLLAWKSLLLASNQASVLHKMKQKHKRSELLHHVGK